MKTRIAPTPSGYLHIGNAFAFLLTWLWARKNGAEIVLRIDDLDRKRFREAYLEDIFDSLAWLGLDYDQGPRNAQEFHREFAQTLQLDAYRDALKYFAGKTYACICSRLTLRAEAAQRGKPITFYPGTCRDQKHEWKPGVALRLKLETPKPILIQDSWMGPQIQTLEKDWGDPLLWSKEDRPSFHLASILDDMRLGITHIVRGMDLLDSTAMQILIAQCAQFPLQIGQKNLDQLVWMHHPLVMTPNGSTKLSKSQIGSEPVFPESLMAWRQKGYTASDLLKSFAKILGYSSIASTKTLKAQDLIADFDGHALQQQNFFLEF